MTCSVTTSRSATSERKPRKRPHANGAMPRLRKRPSSRSSNGSKKSSEWSATRHRASAGNCASSPESGGTEAQRQAVHAVAKAGRSWPVGEDMAEVASAAVAQHLGTNHAEASIGFSHGGVRQYFPETRPAGPTVEFRCRIEQGQRAGRANERALAMLVQERAGEGMLGACLAQDVIAFGAEDTLPFGWGVVDREPDVRGRFAQATVKQQPSGAEARQAQKCASIVHSVTLAPIQPAIQ